MTKHTTEQNAASAMENVRAVAELIFDVLYREGDMKIENLKQEVKHDSPVFDWAIGWLLGKGDIEMVSSGRSFTICRNAPTPAVIPIRGN
jgi:hypothetical protein